MPRWRMVMNKLKRILKIALFDIIGYVIAMGLFLAIFYLVPYELQSEEVVVADEQQSIKFNVPDSLESIIDEDKVTSSQSSKPNKNHSSNNGKYDHLGTEEIVFDDSEATDMARTEITVTNVAEYSSDDIYISVDKKEVGDGDDKVTYYVGHVYVSSLEYFRTALAQDKYGANIKDDVDDIAANNNAIFAITGDSYGNNTTGIVIRDGILYRDDENDADVCVLYLDGTMKTYTAAEFDEESVKAGNVWQAWCFGPALLDGEGDILEEFTTSSYLSKEHPRVAMGYVEPGHYVFMVVDGRDDGYSRGVTISELAVLMQREGCLAAFNLDGGGSATMYFDGEYINKSTGREISDIIYIPRG